jgi:sterol desaturase/sphingolipid hydroxylase (fatty acid hydroxylase superfamily)
MDLVYGKVIAFAAPFFLLAVILEVVLDRVRGTRYYNLPDAVTSVACGTAYIGARVSFAFLGLFAYSYVLNHFAPVTLPSGHWLTWVFAFVLYDLCYYWWHRMSHTVGFLWGSHVVHHQSEEFNLTTALRQPSTAFLNAWIFYLPLALCGVPLTVYLVVGVAQLLYQFWPHTRHIGRLGFLDRWIQTPSNHRVHHAKNGPYLNKNYVGVFMIWDRLFGTFEEEKDDLPCEYGITEPVNAWNPVWANVHFYCSMASDAWRTRSWLDKIRIWFAPPGWRPADLGLRAALRSDPVPHRSKWLISYALVQFAAVIAANQHFLMIFPQQSGLQNILYFAIILLGLTTTSAILEGRREYFLIEAGRLALLGGIVPITGSWLGGIRNPAILTAIVVFSAGSLLWFLVIGVRARPSAARDQKMTFSAS